MNSGDESEATNPYRPPVSDGGPVLARADWPRLYQLARVQRLLLVAVFVNLVVIAVRFLDIAPQWLIAPGWWLSSTAAIATAFLIVRARRGTWLGLLAVPMLSFPLVGIIAMLFISSRANRELKAAGARVSVLGGNLRELSARCAAAEDGIRP